MLNPAYKTKAYGDFLYDMQWPKKTNTSMKWSTQLATVDQIEEIGKMLEKGLQQGAIGIGHCPGYMVSGSTQRESNIVQKLAGEYGVSSFVHGRFSSQKPPTSGLLGIDEMMAPQAIYIARFLEGNGVEQMAYKGRIQVGADADIAIFDPKTAKDNSTMKDGGLPSTGIPYVVVNGTLVVKDSTVLKGVYPGQAIRRPVTQ